MPSPFVAVAQAVKKHLRDQSRPPAKVPATVISYTSQSGQVDTAVVLVDGDTDQRTVASLVAVAAGNRVLIEGRPSGAAYITAVFA